MSDTTDIDKLAFRVIYQRIEKAIDEMDAGDIKRARVTLKQFLPRGYKHSFERLKGPKT